MTGEPPADRNALLVARAEELAVLDLGWRRAMTDVPREAFAPDTIWVAPDGELHVPLHRAQDPESWLREVYAPGPIATQLDPDGTPTSSISATDIVLRMLYDARIGEDERVLELGTGSGWNTGLLCHRVGDENVVSVELDPHLTQVARENLGRVGYKPLIVTGDAAAGHEAGSLYDTALATFSVDRVPDAWINQARVGGYVLTPWRAGHGMQAVIKLVVMGAGRAVGHFTTGCDFMSDRLRATSIPGLQDRVPGDVPGNSRCTDTSLSCSGLFSYSDHARGFAAGLRVGDFRYAPVRAETGDALWLYSTSDDSWAYVYSPDDGSGGTAYQAGPRDLWDEIEHASTWYEQAGRPGVSRFGMSIDGDGERVWLDEPGNPAPAVRR